MSEFDNLGHYSFLPWLRQGLGNRIANNDDLGAASDNTIERAQININVQINEAHSINKSVNIIGPGDVLGISRRAITRVEPKNGVLNFEANYLPYIEFYEDEFLWRYTPALPSGEKLRPWMALVVAKLDEVSINTATDGLAYFTVDSNNFRKIFAKEQQIWAWAHVHLSQPIVNESNYLGEFVQKSKERPDTAVCRLICPRKLDKSTQYRVFLIPSFETGRLAGLGEETKTVKAQLSSWKWSNRSSGTNTRSNQYPIYYQWEFSTGELGDFETLADLLNPFAVDPADGGRPMNIEKVGFGVDENNADKTIPFEGALRPPFFIQSTWPGNKTANKKMRSNLSQLLNLNARLQDPAESQGASNTFNPFYSSNNSPVGVGDDPIITPPMYGKWHAVTRKTQTSKVATKWFDKANLDFRYRGAAGLGNKVVRENQEEYMERAWKQVGQVNEANRKIREAELARRVAKAMHKKHLESIVQDRVILRTSGVHRYLLDGNTGMTIEKLIAESRIPSIAKSAAFRKLTRPSRKTMKAGFDRQETLEANLFTRMNESIGSMNSMFDEINSDAPFTMSLEEITAPIEANIFELTNDPVRLARVEFMELVENVNLEFFDANVLIASAQNQIQDIQVQNQVVGIINNVQAYQQGPTGIEIELNEETFDTHFGANITGRTLNFLMVTKPVAENQSSYVSATVSLTEQVAFLADVNAFGNSYSGLLNTYNVVESAQAPLVDISEVIRTGFIPSRDIVRRVKHLLDLGPAQHEDYLKPVMAYPKLNDPMYLKLVELSQDYIIPNVENLPDNSITLMEGNPEFIESFMLGLNHEFARELLWNEYPTDQRPSTFRAFWDVKDSKTHEETPDEESAYAIKEINKWNGRLGTNSMDTSGLVLIIRGELLRKYPNTMVYAQKGISDGNNGRTINPNPSASDFKLPIFQGEMEPDIHFFGFDSDLTDIEATSGNNGHGWFFCLKERPGQIRFGLDDNEVDPVPSGNANDWNDLSWGHLVNNQNQLNALEMIDLAGTIRANVNGSDEPDWGMNSNSADLAHILLQNPVLFAVHAKKMVIIQ